ncbi:MAG: hypothetical protein U5L72_04065 [Bacteroidales bacterium]|nr:hypothetical protein [Bacteroidales bacterium]
MNPGEDLDNFLAGLGTNNSLEPQAGVQLFGLAFTVGAGPEDQSFGHHRACRRQLRAAGDLIRLGLEGSESFIGTGTSTFLRSGLT